jgi:hypothetical protein
MHKKVEPDKSIRAMIKQFPHCDQRVLHAPGECEFCDKHPVWQALRLGWGIAFTGYEPDGKELPDPATYARGETLNAWQGNVAKPPEA